ncbi:hypothetical protein GCM10010269_59690 [Streptomyces humidus]|uniref:DUF7144 domain-containing protein n=1 Tax=Streptomyces humidus TaxID=52259 RepID=A0A918L5Y0_9ACTN|nr:hypothetical protein [Streptomyces humidus]GGS12497.1 hypothetical protein GCM10010269_59690 [Streptomyces humidus]
MATQSTGMHRTTSREMAEVSGWTIFAAIMMIFGGVLAIFEGISAVSKDDVFVTTRNFTFQWSLTSWGWLHFSLGILVVLAGMALFTGAMWARVVGIAAAGLNLIANFVWLPWYPFWAITLMVIDGFVIWALCVGPQRERAI